MVVYRIICLEFELDFKYIGIYYGFFRLMKSPQNSCTSKKNLFDVNDEQRNTAYHPILMNREVGCWPKTS